MEPPVEKRKGRTRMIKKDSSLDQSQPRLYVQRDRKARRREAEEESDRDREKRTLGDGLALCSIVDK